MNGVSKINVTEDIALVTFHNIPQDLSLTAKILTDFSSRNVNIDMISQSAPVRNRTDVSFTVHSSDVVKSLEIIRELSVAYPDIKPFVNDGNCKIQLYGEEMKHTPGVAAEVFSVVANISSEIMLITTSEVDISILLAQHNMSDAIDALEKHFSVKLCPEM